MRGRTINDKYSSGDFMRFTILVLLALASAAIAADDAILGYDDDASARQREAEALFDASIDTAEMDGWLKLMSTNPHHVGSLASKENAEFIAELLESWGYEVEIAEYQVLLPTPNVREIELVAPTQYRASLREDSLEEDPSTFVRDNLLAPYNAFSVDGEVEGELVFVNYGIPED
jgi:N-acetylated-alpha-linked acidic dipeptidase